MSRIWSIFITGFTILLLIFTINVSASDLISDSHIVTIENSESGLLVTENIEIKNTVTENITTVNFWIQQGAENVEILVVETGDTLSPILNGNVRQCNLSNINITLQTDDMIDIRLTYTLQSTVENFEKTLLYDTTFLSVTFNDRELYQGENLVFNSETSNSVNILLYRPIEAPLTITYIAVIFVLVFIIIIIMLLSLRKQRSKSKKTSIAESKEILTTKKALLLSILKDIEKQYRSKSISDETYNKIKEEFKHQAVEVMRKLEDYK